VKVQRSAVPMIPARAPTTSVPAFTNREEVESILGKLLAMDLSTGKLSPEQLELLDDSFRKLSASGPSGVTAIQEFLDRGVDIGFSEVEGGDAAKYSSLRTALFNALKEAGESGGLQASLHVLKSTADPLEVAILSRNIEQMMPDQYRGEILQAARESL